MTAYYYYLWGSFFALCITIYLLTTTATTSIERIDSAGTAADQTTHSLHQRASTPTSLPSNILSHKRNRQSGDFETKSINTIFHTMNVPTINTNAQWHAWHDRRREQLQWRLDQARHAEWNWPSTRARCEIMRIEREIEQINEDEFIVPNFGDDLKSCASEGARL